MTDINVIIIYLGCIVIGFIIGGIVYYKKYGRMIIEVLDNLKFTKKINTEEYDYYKEKFIKQRDSLKSIRDFTKKFKREKKDE